MAPRPAGQKKRGTKQISVDSGEGDIIDENVVQPSLCHRDFPRAFASVAPNVNLALPQGLVLEGGNPTSGLCLACV